MDNIEPGYEDWQQRLIDEYNELSLKFIKLTRFIESPKFDNLGQGEQVDLRNQRAIMLQYLAVLGSRSTRFLKV